MGLTIVLYTVFFCFFLERERDSMLSDSNDNIKSSFSGSYTAVFFLYVISKRLFFQLFL